MPDLSQRSSHWDLMLQEEDHLLTWALDGNPLVQTEVGATRLDDHRLKYLQFEGNVSGDRGHVQRIAEGQFQWLNRKSVDHWTAQLKIGTQEFHFEMMSNPGKLLIQAC